MGISPRTLRHWQSQPIVKLRGRPLRRASAPRRQEVINFLRRVSGPVIGLPSLRAVFPSLPCCVLAGLLRRYRSVWRQRYRRHGYRLQWHRPGRVWAMDHSRATQLVDGQFEQIFAVRDLASHRQLAWSPVHSTDAEEACQVLAKLLVSHGPPLVIKSDQGSAFVGQVMGSLLKRWRVTPLFSPKGLPQYNGALERSNSTNKAYTHQQAIGEGHPCHWTTQNLEAAQRLSNAIARPWGHDGPSPEQAWQQRVAITTEERDAFQAELQRQRDTARNDLGMAEVEELTPVQQDRLERRAISAALESLGYMSKCPVRRPPKAKRPRRAQLQQALKQLREQEQNADATDREGDDAARVDVNATLATLQSVDTMQAKHGDSSSASTSPRTESTHRESATSTWWRRLITLAINVVEAAKIMR